MTVANAITCMRFLLVPFFVYFFAVGDRGVALVLFCVAGGSDLIDGTVARLLKQRSSWGAVLDPMADKILMESAFVCLVVVGVLPLWFFLIALLRDLLIVFGITYFKIRKIDFPHRAIWSSKFATLFQMATILAGLLWFWRADLALGAVSIRTIMQVCMMVAVVLIVVSGALYVRLGLGLLKSRRALDQAAR